MKRTLLAASVAVLMAVAGCGADRAAAPAAAPTRPAPAAAAPTSPSTPGGVPALLGTPADLTAPIQAQAGAGTPPTGLLTQDVVVGTGRSATPADTVNVRYTGTLYTDGTVFDSSWKRGDTAAAFPLNRVVPGFSQGISGMQPGGRRVIVMPPDLAYGPEANGPIPGGSTLVFVVDLVSIR